MLTFTTSPSTYPLCMRWSKMSWHPLSEMQSPYPPIKEDCGTGKLGTQWFSHRTLLLFWRCCRIWWENNYACSSATMGMWCFRLGKMYCIWSQATQSPTSQPMLSNPASLPKTLKQRPWCRLFMWHLNSLCPCEGRLKYVKCKEQVSGLGVFILNIVHWIDQNVWFTLVVYIFVL